MAAVACGWRLAGRLSSPLLLLPQGLWTSRKVAAFISAAPMLCLSLGVPVGNATQSGSPSLGHDTTARRRLGPLWIRCGAGVVTGGDEGRRGRQAVRYRCSGACIARALTGQDRAQDKEKKKGEAGE